MKTQPSKPDMKECKCNYERNGFDTCICEEPKTPDLEQKILSDFRKQFTYTDVKGYSDMEQVRPDKIEQFILSVIQEVRESEREKIKEVFDFVPSTPDTSTEFERGYHLAYKNVQELLNSLSKKV